MDTKEASFKNKNVIIEETERKQFSIIKRNVRNINLKCYWYKCKPLLKSLNRRHTGGLALAHCAHSVEGVREMHQRSANNELEK